MGNTRRSILVDSEEQLHQVLGNADENLKFIKSKFDTIKIGCRGNEIIVEGQDLDEVNFVYDLLMELKKIASQTDLLLKPSDIVKYMINTKEKKNGEDISSFLKSAIYISERGRPIFPKTPAQKKYIFAIKQKDIVFGVGPAGTGKTYLAIAMGVSFLKDNSITRLILSRPVVEAGGERLGYLPGDIHQKIHPYLYPLYDALYDIIGYSMTTKLQQESKIEVLPLAYMRGRTLNDAFVILDEAQNTTPEQMKLFLSRLGFDSKAVITGDITQIDLPKNKLSGLVHASQILSNIEGIEFVYFDKSDIIRHKLVSAVLKAYEESEENEYK